jgi:hypothetical protein
MRLQPIVCLVFLLFVTTVFDVRVEAQSANTAVVHVSALVGKSPAEIEQILGKPKRSEAVNRNKLLLPVTLEHVPDYYQFYKIANIGLSIWFYQDKPILFESGFREPQKIKVSSGNKVDRLTLEEAFLSIGFDIKDQKPNEIKFITSPTNPRFSPRTRIKIWNKELNGEKWDRVEAHEMQFDRLQFKKGLVVDTIVRGVWIVPPRN